MAVCATCRMAIDQCKCGPRVRKAVKPKTDKKDKSTTSTTTKTTKDDGVDKPADGDLTDTTPVYDNQGKVREWLYKYVGDEVFIPINGKSKGTGVTSPSSTTSSESATLSRGDTVYLKQAYMAKDAKV